MYTASFINKEGHQLKFRDILIHFTKYKYCENNKEIDQSEQARANITPYVTASYQTFFSGILG